MVIDKAYLDILRSKVEVLESILGDGWDARRPKGMVAEISPSTFEDYAKTVLADRKLPDFVERGYETLDDYLARTRKPATK